MYNDALLRHALRVALSRHDLRIALLRHDLRHALRVALLRHDLRFALLRHDLRIALLRHALRIALLCHALRYYVYRGMASSQNVNVLYTPVARQPTFQCPHCVHRCFNRAGLINHVRTMHGSQETSAGDGVASSTSASQHSNNEEEHLMDVDAEHESYDYENGSDMDIIHDNNTPTESSDSESESLSPVSASVHVSESSSQHPDNVEEHHVDEDFDVQPAYLDDDHNLHDNNSTSSGSESPPIIPSSPHHDHEPRPHQHQQYPANDRYIRRVYHDKLNGLKCDQHGVFNIGENTPPPPRESDRGPDNWMPYAGRVEFELAEFIYQRNQMSGPDIDHLLYLWSVSAANYGQSAPFQNHKHLYDTIDATPLGDVPWETFSLKFNGDKPENNAPPWMDASYDVWFREIQILIKDLTTLHIRSVVMIMVVVIIILCLEIGHGDRQYVMPMT